MASIPSVIFICSILSSGTVRVSKYGSSDSKRLLTSGRSGGNLTRLSL